MSIECPISDTVFSELPERQKYWCIVEEVYDTILGFKYPFATENFLVCFLDEETAKSEAEDAGFSDCYTIQLSVEAIIESILEYRLKYPRVNVAGYIVLPEGITFYIPQNILRGKNESIV